jgi:hypothetical protein
MRDAPALPPAPARFRKRIFIPVAFIAVVTALLLWEIVRGNWSDPQPRNPSTTAGIVTQLVRGPEDRKQIRAALILNAPAQSVWNVVTDYNHFADIFQNVRASKGVRDSDGRWHLTGEIRSFLARWPMDVHVRHEESPGRFVASWDEPHDAWKINRGSWVVTQHGRGETLLEYNLELRVSPFPDCIVRAVLLDQLKPVMRAVRNQVEKDQSRR